MFLLNLIIDKDEILREHMEKKGTIISLILIAVVLLSAVGYIIFSGTTAQEYNYVQLEINPRVEFLCDKNFKVVSFRPLNEDAEVLLVGVEYKGMDIKLASTDFIDICARAGYIDVDGDDNAVCITVIDGITQALDVHVTQEVYNYLRKNEILCAVVENYEDRNMFDEKKKNNVCCTNKFKLMQTMLEYLPDKKLEDLNKLSEVELIDMVNNLHQEYSFIPTETQIELKTKLIDFNREKYNTHKNKISNKTQQEFSEKFDKFQKTKGQTYMINFNKSYTEWQNAHIS